jgi:HEAT repeat protein
MIRTVLLAAFAFATLPALAIPTADQIAQEAAAARASDPGLAQAVDGIAFVKNRAGLPRPVFERAGDPTAALLIAHRILAATDDDTTRAQLVRLLLHARPDLAHRVLLHDPSEAVRAMTSLVLARAEYDDRVRALLDGLGDPAPSVRAAFARAATEESAPEVLEALQQALRDPEPGVRSAAAWTLGVHRTPTAIPALENAMNDPDAQVQLEALRALHRVAPDNARAHPMTAKLAANPDPRIARAARRILDSAREPARENVTPR